MMKNTPFDTITAISTPPGEGGIGIVRISGELAFDIVKKIFRPHKQNIGDSPKHFSMRLGYIQKNNAIIDEVLISFMKAPHTYTREDIVEINCHGGAIAVNEVLRLILKEGARMAEPGEFTKRAFINGRIDLSQAEAVLNIVKSKTNKALEAAVNQLRGSLSNSIQELVDSLKSILVILESNIDFPEEEDISPIQIVDIKERIGLVRSKLNSLIVSYDTGKIIRDGILTVLSGKPNVGKSSILNAFLKFERAIVTPIPGTTRDIIEEQLNIDGIPFILADTAGITRSDDLIEKEGVKRSKNYMEKAQLILLVFDGSDHFDERDIEIIQKAKSYRYIPIINKTDLDQKLEVDKLVRQTDIQNDFIYLSAKEGKGLKDLEKRMTESVISGNTGGDYSLMVTNARHYTILLKAYEELCHGVHTVNEGGEAELVAYDVRSTMDILGEIIGEVTKEEIIDEIFRNFCIGK